MKLGFQIFYRVLFKMSDYQDYSWRVALGDTETELPDLTSITYTQDTDMESTENSTFDVTVCGNLTEDYKMVNIKYLMPITN